MFEISPILLKVLGAAIFIAYAFYRWINGDD